MEPTITQNGALFAVQHRPVKSNYSQHNYRQIASPNKTISTLRTSVGEFVFRQTPLGCHLELVVGNARWALGLYGTNEAAIRALKNGRTGFRTWDALGLLPTEGTSRFPTKRTRGRSARFSGCHSIASSCVC
jgi:hypothetical protein